MKEYIQRNYRKWMASGDLTYFKVKLRESDLYIGALKDLSKEALISLKKHREIIENYIEKKPLFKTSLKPLPLEDEMPEIIREMAESGLAADVGPMAAIAGIIAHKITEDLLNYSEEIIVENGGDIYISGKKERKVAIFAGKSILSGRLAINLQPSSLPVAIATSSGTVGPSISFGKADAAIILSPSGALADSVATATGNLIKTHKDFEKAINFAKNIKGIKGIILICDERISIWGDINIAPINVK